MVQQVLTMTKALSDETRLRALMAIRERELCLCQLVDLLGLAPSTISKHMTLLQQAGLCERRKDGRWHFYRLAGPDAPDVVREALAWIVHALEDSPIVQDDDGALSEVRRKDLEELAACYRT
jgi:ArsR family transcriptional regulator